MALELDEYLSGRCLPHAADLVGSAGDNFRPIRTKCPGLDAELVPREGEQIGVAEAGRADAHEHLTGSRFGLGHLVVLGSLLPRHHSVGLHERGA